MQSFKTLISIGKKLREFLREVELRFSIRLDQNVIEQIFYDAEDDQVSEKHYLLFQEGKKLMRKQLTIRGSVDECEPETIWIEIENISARDVKHFDELTM